MPGMSVSSVRHTPVDELIGEMDFTKMSLANIISSAKENRKNGRQLDLLDPMLNIE